jgi:hypothetical protein
MKRNIMMSGVLDEIRTEKLQNKYQKLYRYTKCVILFLISVVLVCFFFRGKNFLNSTTYNQMGKEAASSGVNRVRREAENLIPSNIEVKNGGAIPPFPIPDYHRIVLNQLSTQTTSPLLLQDIYFFPQGWSLRSHTNTEIIILAQS